jgi:methionyl-tRNA formyltransferase
MHVLFPDCTHPAYHHILTWCRKAGVTLIRSLHNHSGDVLVLISCTEIIHHHNFNKMLVIHESDLPRGRGWSPLADRVDSGDIIKQEVLVLEGHELADEIHAKSAQVKIKLLEWALNNELEGKAQDGVPSYYRRRGLCDSKIDPYKPLAEQFDLLRICEPRFPAFFEHRGHTYQITIRKHENSLLSGR